MVPSNRKKKANARGSKKNECYWQTNPYKMVKVTSNGEMKSPVSYFLTITRLAKNIYIYKRLTLIISKVDQDVRNMCPPPWEETLAQPFRCQIGIFVPFGPTALLEISPIEILTCAQ